MRVLVLTAEARVPDLSALYQSLPRYLDIDLHVLGKAQQRQLRRYLAGLDLQSYQRILLDLPFKHMVAQATLLARLPGLLASLGTDLQRARGQLVVAPETAVPLLPAQLDALAPGWWAAHVEPIGRSGRAALIGLPLGDFDSGYTNSVAGVHAGAPYRYDKHHLVPFGEFIPTGFRWFTELMRIPLGDFARGPLRAPSFEALGQRFGPNVCYEDLFGEELAARFSDAAGAPTVLVNLSNIAWFGDTVALPQHLHITRMRTLELERPMLRATNTGVTAIVDHRAQVVEQLPPFLAGVLEGEVQARQGLTPYAWWVGRFGLWPLGLGAVWVALACVRRAARRIEPRP